MKYRYGALVEWYWQEETEVFEKKICPIPSVNLKSHMHWPGVELGFPSCQADTAHLYAVLCD